MKLSEYINIDLLNEMINDGYINVQYSEKFPDLKIYNYSKSCQMNKIWNDVTCKCRGLIVDSDDNMFSRPFVKFWNYEELSDKSVIPNIPFEVYEKMDGSLGIMYWVNDIPYIATRGSMNSAQGKHATEILHKKYSKYFTKLDQSKTYLFEIIWNEDHHCVSYGDYDDIVLLASVDIETGEEEDIYKYSDIFTCTKRYDGVSDWKTIRELFDGTNREGFVVRFANNYRLKMKYEQYFKIHFLRCMLNEKTVLNALISGTIGEFDETILDLDEENQIYYHKLVNKFKDWYTRIESECAIETQKYVIVPDREAARYIVNHKYSGVIFNMRKKSAATHSSIWKYVKKEWDNERKGKTDRLDDSED